MSPGLLQNASSHIIVTGATGYIGSNLVTLALKRGYRVTAMARSHPVNAKVRYLPFDLSEQLEFLPSKAESLVHLAADTVGGSVTELEEVRAAKRLLDLSLQQGTRFIFVSSQSASGIGLTRYSRVKWAIEQEVLSRGSYIVRPGLVYGGDRESGLYGTILSLIGRSFALPHLVPGPIVHPIHVNDLCAGLLALATMPHPRSQIYCLGSIEPVSFTEFLVAVARHRLRRRRLFVPVPVGVAKATLSLASRIDHRWTYLHDRLVSLMALKPMNTIEDMASLGIVPEPLHRGLKPPERVQIRSLVAEALMLMNYLVGGNPSRAAAARYVKAVKSVRSGEALPLPSLVLRYPKMLSLIDRRFLFAKARWYSELDKRIDMAVRLVETTPIHAEAFLMRKGVSRPRAFLMMAVYLLLEGLEMMFSLAFYVLHEFGRVLWPSWDQDERS